MVITWILIAFFQSNPFYTNYRKGAPGGRRCEGLPYLEKSGKNLVVANSSMEEVNQTRDILDGTHARDVSVHI